MSLLGGFERFNRGTEVLDLGRELSHQLLGCNRARRFQDANPIVHGQAGRAYKSLEAIHYPS